MSNRMLRLENMIGHLQAAMDNSRATHHLMTDAQLDLWQEEVEDHIETARVKCWSILEKARRLRYVRERNG